MQNTAVKHPGKILAEIMEEREIDFWGLIRRTKCSPFFIEKVLKGEEDITEELATRLELGFTIPKKYWLNLQENYNKRRF